jgi:serine/threonine protein kinase
MIFTISEYKDCLSFDDSFKTLKHLESSKDENGDFIFSSGRNSVVFKMIDKQSNAFKALKCFINVNEDQLTYIKEVSEYLQYIKSSYVVPYQYFDQELWLASSYEEPQYYPVLLMDWVEGKTMGQHLDVLCQSYDYFKIKDLALAFDQMALWLLHQDFAHGDLKLDNIIVNQSGLPILIDYDGCFIPGMEGTDAQELGTPGYQHPLRDEHFFNKNIDEVGILVISSALHALVKEPELWVKYNNGENLLFTATDLDCPQESLLWEQLIKLDHELVSQRLALLQYGLVSISSIPEIIYSLRMSPFVKDYYSKLIRYIMTNEELWPFCKNNYYGFANIKGTVRIDAKYDEVEPFVNCSNKLLIDADEDLTKEMLVKEKKIGLINKIGDEVVSIKYDDIICSIKEYAKVKLNDKYGIIDKTGIEVLPIIYDSIFESKDDDIEIVEIDKKYGIINRFTKTVLTEVKYDKILPFKTKNTNGFNTTKYFSEEGFAAVQINDKYGFIDLNGNELTSIKCDNIFCEIYYRTGGHPDGYNEWSGEYYDSYYYDNYDYTYYLENRFCGDIDGKKVFIDINGREIFGYDNCCFLENGFVLVNIGAEFSIIDDESEYMQDSPNSSHDIPFFEGGKWGALSKDNEIIIPIIYNKVELLKDDFFKVESSKMFGIYSDNGNVIIEAKYDEIFILDKYFIVKQDGKYGIISKIGIIVIPSLYDSIEKKNDLFIVFNGEKWGGIDGNGCIVIPILYDSISVNEELFVVESNSFYGCINIDGDTVIPIVYSSIYYFNKTYIQVFQDKKYWLIDKTGKKITEFEKKVYYINEDETLIVIANSDSYNYREYGLLNKNGELLTKCIYNKIEKREDGFYCVNIGGHINREADFVGGKWGLIDNKGEIVIPIKFDYEIEIEKALKCEILKK